MGLIRLISGWLLATCCWLLVTCCWFVIQIYLIKPTDYWLPLT